MTPCSAVRTTLVRFRDNVFSPDAAWRRQAAMVMVDRGRLDLDAPVSRYLLSYPRPTGERITTRQVMSHTAGVRHYRGDEFASNVGYDDVVAPLEVFWGDPLLFEPGTDYSYSTYGWTVVRAAGWWRTRRTW